MRISNRHFRASTLNAVACVLMTAAAAHATPELSVMRVDAGVFAVSATGSFPTDEGATTVLGTSISAFSTAPPPISDLSATGLMSSAIVPNGFSLTVVGSATTPLDSPTEVQAEGRGFAYVEFTVSEGGPLMLRGSLHATLHSSGFPFGDAFVQLLRGSTVLFGQTASSGEDEIDFTIPSADAGVYGILVQANGQSIGGAIGAPIGIFTGDLTLEVTTVPAPAAGLLLGTMPGFLRRRRGRSKPVTSSARS